MRPVDFKGSNKTFVKPKSMTDEECLPLRALVGKDINGGDFIATAWQPNKEDIEAINRGEPIFVHVVGTGLPPMLLYTVNELGEANL